MLVNRLCLAALVMSLGLLSGCAMGTAPLVATPTTSADVGIWAALEQRPLRLPTLVPGAMCPAAKGRMVNPSFGPALGDGPAYPVGLGASGALLYAPPANFESHDWGGNKVFWVVDPATRDAAILVRGHQLDGPHEVRFEHGDVPPAELRIVPDHSNPGGWSVAGSYTRVSAPGCYAYQIDSVTFSKVIIFTAVAAM